MSAGLVEVLASSRLVAIVRGLAPSDAVPAAEAAFAAGIRVVEITMDSPEAVSSIRALVASAKAAHGHVGAGTVVSDVDLRAATTAGAHFCVSPHLDVGLLNSATESGMPFVPGVVTPTEAAVAVSAGAIVVKLFPAGPLGPGWMRILRGPYPDLQVLATGGITAGASGEWLAAGAVAVGLGSELVGRGIAPADVARRCRAALAATVAGEQGAVAQSFRPGGSSSAGRRTQPGSPA